MVYAQKTVTTALQRKDLLSAQPCNIQSIAF